MDNPEKTAVTNKNGQSRENRSEKTRMDNPEKTAVTIKNGQSRENRSDNQEWTIQRKPE